MITLIMVIALMWMAFKVSFFTLGLFGRLIGSLIGFVFYLVIGIFALVFGLGFFMLPVIAVVGIICLICAGSKA